MPIPKEALPQIRDMLVKIIQDYFAQLEKMEGGMGGGTEEGMEGEMAEEYPESPQETVIPEEE